ncbi:hypothetical protein [Mycolicibacter algericus]|uniref:hypothetical protein n=1 Tax=Mycolicibacter algericus TaxID=1288388 RepID=UPI003C713010
MQLADAKAKMGAIRADLQREVDAICANANYSTDGQVRMIAQAVLDTRDQAVALRDEFVTTAADTRRKLAQQLFGLPAGADPAAVLVFRDAEDRAAKITDPDELAPLLARATDRGDAVMAKAIAAHADAHGWTEFAAAWAASTGKSDAYAELTSLPHGGNFDTAVALIFSVGVPNLPPELAAIIRAAAPGVLSADDATRNLQKLAEQSPEQPAAPVKAAKRFRPSPVGTIL